MSIQNATLIKKGLAFGGTIPDYSSAIGYKESIGDTCKNPNGYTVGSFFVGSNDGYFYKVTSAIAYGDTLTVGVSGNCEQTSISAEINQLGANLIKTYSSTNTTTSAGDMALIASTTNLIAVTSTQACCQGFLVSGAYWYGHFTNLSGTPLGSTAISYTVYYI